MGAALMARHIGGAVNYVAVAGVLNIPGDLVAAGLAAGTCWFSQIQTHGLLHLCDYLPSTPRP